jgi:hypothetical protein
VDVRDGGGRNDDDNAAKLLALAIALRDGALEENRADVAAKAEEVVALLGGERDASRGGSRRIGDTVTRILDGLGL